VSKRPLTLFLLVTALAGCAAYAQAQEAGDEGGTASLCMDGDQMRNGPYVYENNQWGKAKASGSFSQCLLRRTVDGVPQYGWTWDWPGFNASVFAYPEVIYGWKPWSGGRSTDPKLPMKVTDIRTMKMIFDLDLQAAGAYNLAPEIWLTSTGEASARAAPGRITTEVMFWMNHNNTQPAGTFMEKMTVDGFDYQLWKLDSMGDTGNGRGWVYYAFVSSRPQNKATLDIRQFIQYLLLKNDIAAENYVASIEFGNEVAGGKGTAWLKEYSLLIE
jgi:Glycosyl hydrolase family 12